MNKEKLSYYSRSRRGHTRDSFLFELPVFDMNPRLSKILLGGPYVLADFL